MGLLDALHGGRREGGELGAGSAGCLGTRRWGKERELKATAAIAVWVRCQPGVILTWADSPVPPAKGEPALAEACDASANKHLGRCAGRLSGWGTALQTAPRGVSPPSSPLRGRARQSCPSVGRPACAELYTGEGAALAIQQL